MSADSGASQTPKPNLKITQTIEHVNLPVPSRSQALLLLAIACAEFNRRIDSHIQDTLEASGLLCRVFVSNKGGLVDVHDLPQYLRMIQNHKRWRKRRIVEVLVAS
jgi:hypothetical protein